MKTIGQFQFPETVEEAKTWRASTHYRALHSRVLVVRRTRIEGMWAAYCSDVPGEDHAAEWEEALRHGDKLHESIARAIFPDVPAELPYAE